MGATEQMVTACPEITIVKTVDDIEPFLTLYGLAMAGELLTAG